MPPGCAVQLEDESVGALQRNRIVTKPTVPMCQFPRKKGGKTLMCQAHSCLVLRATAGDFDNARDPFMYGA